MFLPLQAELNKIQYEDGMNERLEERRVELREQMRNAQQKATSLESRYFFPCYLFFCLFFLNMCFLKLLLLF